MISDADNLNIDLRSYFSLFLLVTAQVVLGVNFSGYLDQSIIMVIMARYFWYKFGVHKIIPVFCFIRIVLLDSL
jgi:hypothetical protein